MLLNKQHHHMAFDIDEMIQWLSLVPLFRKSKCPCVMVECSTEPDCHKILGARRAVKCGLRMHLKNIARNYEVLCERVQQDTEKHRTVEEQIRGAERHVKNCDVAEGSTVKFAATTMVGNQRSREDGRRRPEEETHEYGQLTLPGTPKSDLVVSQRCPIIRRTTIDMGGDDDAPEGSVDRSVQVTLAQEGDTLLEGGGSDEPLESTERPWHDSARLRDLADDLEALFSDHREQVQTEAGERSRLDTVSPSDLVYGLAEESVQRLLLHFQDPPRGSTPSTPSNSTSTPSSSTSRDSSEVYRQELRLLSTAMVDQAMDNLSGSSQSTSPDLRVKKSVSFADEREDSLGQVKQSVSSANEWEDPPRQVATEKKRSKKFNFSHLRKLGEKSKKKKPEAGHPEDDTRTSE
ncbi:ADP-ribosylation factor-like protein 13B [Osmerus eperlanus]|uniref:ADP-ribosylation factor-like protein 13B n=1 Tax=Osmerus eperlanus TaxID=29151 RepID=UPI002E142A6B